MLLVLHLAGASHPSPTSPILLARSHSGRDPAGDRPTVTALLGTNRFTGLFSLCVCARIYIYFSVKICSSFLFFLSFRRFDAFSSLLHRLEDEFNGLLYVKKGLYKGEVLCGLFICYYGYYIWINYYYFILFYWGGLGRIFNFSESWDWNFVSLEKRIL